MWGRGGFALLVLEGGYGVRLVGQSSLEAGWGTIVVDAHAVVECLLSQLLFGVVEHGFREGRGGERNAGDGLIFGSLEAFFCSEEGGNVARLRGPAVGFEGRWRRHDGGRAG